MNWCMLLSTASYLGKYCKLMCELKGSQCCNGMQSQWMTCGMSYYLNWCRILSQIVQQWKYASAHAVVTGKKRDFRNNVSHCIYIHIYIALCSLETLSGSEDKFKKKFLLFPPPKKLFTDNCLFNFCQGKGIYFSCKVKIHRDVNCFCSAAPFSVLGEQQILWVFIL